MSSAPKTPIRPAEWHPDVPDVAECRRRLALLQPRQREVIALLAHGWTPKQIARRLGITQKTAQNHLFAASEVLDVRPPQPAVVALYHRAMSVEADVVEAPGRWLVTELRALAEDERRAS